LTEQKKLKDKLAQNGYTKYIINKIIAANSKQTKPNKKYKSTPFFPCIKTRTNTIVKILKHYINTIFEINKKTIKIKNQK